MCVHCDNQFPKFLLKTGAGSHSYTSRFVCIHEAARAYFSSAIYIEVGDKVLDANGSLRLMTEEEQGRLNALVAEYETE